MARYVETRDVPGFRRLTTLCTVSGLALVLAAGPSGWAQEAEPESDEQAPAQDTIVVTGIRSSLERAQDILRLVADFHDGDTRPITKNGAVEEVVVSRVFPTTHFGFRKVTVERPLRLNFCASPDRIARLEDERGFQALARSKKRGAAGAQEQAVGEALQEAIRGVLRALPDTLFTDREAFERALDGAMKAAGVRLPAPARKARSRRGMCASAGRWRQSHPTW